MPFLKPFDVINLNNGKENVGETPIKAFDISNDKRSIFYWE